MGCGGITGSGVRSPAVKLIVVVSGRSTTTWSFSKYRETGRSSRKLLSYSPSKEGNRHEPQSTKTVHWRPTPLDDRYVFRLFELPHGMEPAARPNIRPSAARLRAQATSSRLDRNSSPTAQLASAGAHHHRTSQPKQRHRSKANTRSLKRTGLELIGGLSWPSFEGKRISETESAHRRLRLVIPYLMLFSHSYPENLIIYTLGSQHIWHWKNY